jgi:hypothetical protein
MVVNATFNNIFVISSQVTDKLYHKNSGDSTDYTGSCKSNYYAITATTAPFNSKNSLNISEG